MKIRGPFSGAKKYNKKKSHWEFMNPLQCTHNNTDLPPQDYYVFFCCVFLLYVSWS